MNPTALSLSVTAIFLIVRVLKDDTRFPTIPVRARPWLSLALGLVAGVIEKVIAGSTWQEAATFGLYSGVLPILTHVLGVESIAGDRDLWLPAWFKAPAPTPKPPDDDEPPAVAATTALVIACALLVACGSSQACPSDSDRVREGREFQAKVLRECDKTRPLSQCTAYPGLRAEHDEYRRRYRECPTR